MSYNNSRNYTSDVSISPLISASKFYHLSFFNPSSYLASETSKYKQKDYSGLQAFICISVIFGIFAIVIFLFAHSDEMRRRVGWIFVASGLIGIFFHAFHANSIHKTRDGFEFGTDIYFIVIVYFFCCYLHFRDIPKPTNKHSNSTERPGRSRPENISVDPQWKAQPGEGDLFTNEALPADNDDVSLE